MTDVIVTTPKSMMSAAAEEARDAQRCPGVSYYLRRFVTRPRGVGPGSRCYYVEDGHLRGFAVVERVEDRPRGFTCETTGAYYGPGFYLVMRSDSWCWVTPLPYLGFQGYRVAPTDWRNLPIVGDWLAPRPKPPARPIALDIGGMLEGMGVEFGKAGAE